MRLKPFTEVIPKPLLPVGGKSLLEIQISRLKSCGFDEIFLATGHKSEYIRNFMGDGSRYGVRLEVSPEKKPLGTVGPVTLLRSELTEPFLLVNGDILTTFDFSKLMNFALQADSDLAVATKIINIPFHFGKVISQGHYIIDVEEKGDMRFEVLAGIYVLKPPILQKVPDDTFYGIDMLIKKILQEKKRVAKYLMTDYWLDIGQVQDYASAEHAYKMHFQDEEI